MRKAVLIAGLVLGAALLGGVRLPASPPAGKSEAPSAAPAPAPSEIDVSIDCNEQYFSSALRNHPRGMPGEGKGLAGGIISHHDLASDLIAEFFAELSARSSIKTFVLVGPNHANAGAPALSGRIRWQTPLGEVNTDYGYLDKLEASGFLACDERAIRGDHAIRTLLPFIRHYFPAAKVVPILFTSEMTMKKDTLLADQLALLAGEDTFVLASLDFSHYLGADEAAEKDALTLASIRNRDYAAIAEFDNDYVDSPWALIAFLRALEKSGAGEMEILRHANSADFPGADRQNTTSYFSIVYPR